MKKFKLVPSFMDREYFVPGMFAWGAAITCLTLAAKVVSSPFPVPDRDIGKTHKTYSGCVTWRFKCVDVSIIHRCSVRVIEECLGERVFSDGEATSIFTCLAEDVVIFAYG